MNTQRIRQVHQILRITSVDSSYRPTPLLHAPAFSDQKLEISWFSSTGQFSNIGTSQGITLHTYVRNRMGLVLATCM